MLEVEQFGIEHIPDDQRKSRPVNLFFILHGSCITFSLFVIGWFPIAFGLSWWASFSAVAVGSLVGGLLLTPMGLFGPRTGTNNPVAQRRALRRRRSSDRHVPRGLVLGRRSRR